METSLSFRIPGAFASRAQQSRRLIAREDAGGYHGCSRQPQPDGSGCAKIALVAGIVQVSVCPPDDRLKLKYLGRYALARVSSSP